VSPSVAIIWVKCFRETGRCAAKLRGGSTSPLEKHADFLLAPIEVEPDLTLGWRKAEQRHLQRWNAAQHQVSIGWACIR
jgi:hypothetical protein